ncbi:MAG: hypothetical protein JWP01_3634 [Myxococcales bacterium]|nr:hypothetical protein [Myxococcales bacterium]
MCLFLDRSIYSYCGGTLVQVQGCEGRVARSGKAVDRFVVEVPIEWLKVSPDGSTVLIFGAKGTRIWRWRDGVGCERFLQASNTRDILGCGFIAINGSIVTLVSSDGSLLGLGADDRSLFASNLRSPHSFAPRAFCQLPGDRLALTGAFFSDPCDATITVPLNELFNNPDAVQQAIKAKAPVRDRAMDVTVGPCDPGAAVVLRDPENEEIGDDDDDEHEDRADVANFAGVYIREFETGRLVERHPYAGRAGSGAAIIATTNWIVVQTVGGVDMIQRSTGTVRHVPRAILDVSGAQLAMVRDHDLTSVTSIDSVV